VTRPRSKNGAHKTERKREGGKKKTNYGENWPSHYEEEVGETGPKKTRTSKDERKKIENAGHWKRILRKLQKKHWTGGKKEKTESGPNRGRKGAQGKEVRALRNSKKTKTLKPPPPAPKKIAGGVRRGKGGGGGNRKRNGKRKKAMGKKCRVNRTRAISSEYKKTWDRDLNIWLVKCQWQPTGSNSKRKKQHGGEGRGEEADFPAPTLGRTHFLGTLRREGGGRGEKTKDADPGITLTHAKVESIEEEQRGDKRTEKCKTIPKHSGLFAMQAPKKKAAIKGWGKNGSFKCTPDPLEC